MAIPDDDAGGASGDAAAPPVGGPAPLRRPHLAALWIVAVLAATVWPLVSHLLGRRLG